MSGESPHITILKRQWELNRKAQKKIRVVGGKVETYESSPPAADLTKILAAATAAERVKVLDTDKIGQMIGGQGVFFGTWEPKDSEGKSLGKIFNMFAAPEDLTDSLGAAQAFKYTEAMERVAGLKNWHGHEGTPYTDSKELIEALKDGTYNGGWFIPPRELTVGKDAKGNAVQADHLHAHHDKGVLRGTFALETSSPGTCSLWYWSSTTCPDRAAFANNVRFLHGHEDWNHKKSFPLSCRLVRLVEARL